MRSWYIMVFNQEQQRINRDIFFQLHAVIDAHSWKRVIQGKSSSSFLSNGILDERIESSYLIGTQRQAVLWARTKTRKESIDLQHLWHPCSNTQELFSPRFFISFDDEMSGINARWIYRWNIILVIFQNVSDHRNWTRIRIM